MRTLVRLALTLTTTVLVTFARADDSAFTFDDNGNLLRQFPASLAAPQILAHPQDQVVEPGELGSFFVVVANTRDLTYQWRFNGTDIGGATGDALLLTNISAANEGQYSVVLSNSSGSVTSAPAALMLDSDSDGLPDSWEVASFGNLNQNPTGDFDGDGISNLNEYLDGTDPANNASVRFRLTVQSSGGLVTVTPSKLSYTNGEVVTLTATPFPPDIFHGWTGDMNSYSNTIALVMNAHKSVFAHQGSEILVWTNTVGGNWHVATNWNPNFVPGPNDDVTINLSITASINASADCRSLILGSGGNPTISGTGTLTLHGDSIWYNGSMTGTGRTIVAAGGLLNLMPTTSAFLTTRTLDNAGTVLWTGSVNLTFNNAVLTNRPGALFHQQGSGDFNNAVSSVARFDNAGTFRKSTDTGTMSVVAGVAFNNYNTVEIQSGGLFLSGGGLNQGTMTCSAGTTLDLHGGTFSANGVSSITGAANLIVSGATANLAGLCSLSGNHTFSSGTVNLTGAYYCTNNLLTVNGGTANCNGTGLILPTTINLSVGTLGGTNFISFGSTMNWTGGTVSGNARALIPVGGTLNLMPVSGASLTTRTLDNAGTILWTGSVNLTFNNAVLTNRPGALFHQQGSGDFNNAVSSVARFDNAGTFRKSTDTGTMSVVTGVAFNNYNAVEVQSGGLFLTGGGLNQGVMDFPANTTLNLNGGTFNANGTSSITGAGNLIVSGATANLAGLCSLSGNHTFSAGTANLTGAYYCTNNLLTVNGGTANCNGTGLILPTTINLSVGTLGGTNFISFGSTMNWTSGNLSGNARALIPVGGNLNLVPNASGAFLVTRTLENAGTILMSGTGNLVFTSSVLTNRAGALVHNLGAGDFSATVSSVSRFDNAGTFRKSTDTGTMSVVTGVAFNNYNTVEVQSGGLFLTGGGLNQGTMDFSANTTLNLNGGTFSANGVSSINGAANLIVSGATANLAGLCSLSGNHTFSGGTANLTGAYYCTNNLLTVNGGTANCNGTGLILPTTINLSVGTLGGTNFISFGSTMNWTSGSLSGSGRALIPTGGTLNLTPNGSGAFLVTRTLENAGTILMSGTGNFIFTSSVLTNRAGALVHNLGAGDFNATVSSVSRFDNAGTFRKSTDTGTMSVVTGVAFNNYNTTEIRSGILAPSGGYTSTTNSLLSCAIGGTAVGTGYGRLQVSGAVTLNGALSVSLANGFIPTTNDTFTVLTAGTRSGTFANFYFPSNAVTMQLSNTTTSVIVRVSEVLVLPQPTLLQPELLGPDIRLTWTAVSNLTYRLEFNPDLNPSNWTALPGDVISLSNTASKLDPLTSSNRLYRVRVIP